MSYILRNGFIQDVIATDPIPSIAGAGAYFDGAKPSQSEDTGDPSWTDSSNVGTIATQTTMANYPVRDAANREWEFSGNQYFDLDQKVFLSRSGFRLFFTIDRTAAADDIVVGVQDAAASSGTNGGLIVQLRAANVLLSVIGGAGPNFNTTALGTGVMSVEINYDGAGNWEIFKDGVSEQTVVTAAIDGIFFDRVGFADTFTGDNFDGSIKAIVVYNGQDAGDISTIRTTLNSKFIATSLGADVPYQSFTVTNIDGAYLMGDSQCLGREATTSVTAASAPNAFLSSPITGGLIFNTTSQVFETYQAGTSQSGETSGDFGTEASFIERNLNASFGNKEEFFVLKSALGSSTIGDSVVQGQRWNKTADTLYATFLRQHLIATQWLKENHYNPTVTGMVELVGTNDAADNTDATNYQSNITTFNSDVRTDFGLANLPIITFTILTETFASTVNTGMTNAAAADANMTYSTATVGSTLPDGVHYSADDLMRIGRDYYDNWFASL